MLLPALGEPLAFCLPPFEGCGAAPFGAPPDGCATLVPPLHGQPAVAREAELMGFLDDYLSLLRWLFF